MNATRFPHDQTAQQGLTRMASLNSLSLPIEKSALSMAQFRAGRPVHAVNASQRAKNSPEAVFVNAPFLAGGLPL